MARGGNRALQLNPPNADLHISTHASDWLWSAFSVFALSMLVMVVLDFLVSYIASVRSCLQSSCLVQRPRGARLFHQLATIILATFTLGYYSMASDLGATPIYVEFRGHGYDPTRQIWVSSLFNSSITTFPYCPRRSMSATFSGSSPSRSSCWRCCSPVASLSPIS